MKPVEGEYLVEAANAPGVPPAVLRAVLRRGEERREDAVLLHEFQQVGIPLERAVVFLDLVQALLLEEVNGLEHHLPGALIGIVVVVVFRVQ